MPTFNLLNYSKKFRKTTRSFWNYYLDKPSSGYTYMADIAANRIARERIFR